MSKTNCLRAEALHDALRRVAHARVGLGVRPVVVPGCERFELRTQSLGALGVDGRDRAEAALRVVAGQVQLGERGREGLSYRLDLLARERAAKGTRRRPALARPASTSMAARRALGSGERSSSWAISGSRTRRIWLSTTIGWDDGGVARAPVAAS